MIIKITHNWNTNQQFYLLLIESLLSTNYLNHNCCYFLWARKSLKEGFDSFLGVLIAFNTRDYSWWGNPFNMDIPFYSYSIVSINFECLTIGCLFD